MAYTLRRWRCHQESAEAALFARRLSVRAGHWARRIWRSPPGVCFFEYRNTLPDPLLNVSVIDIPANGIFTGAQQGRWAGICHEATEQGGGMPAAGEDVVLGGARRHGTQHR